MVKSTSRTPSYILISFSTNKIAKGGNSGDKLVVDDIEMIYNKRLSYLNIDGKPMPGFNPDITEYTYACDDPTRIPDVSAETQSPNATVSIEKSTEQILITVTHDDGEKVYRIGLRDEVAGK